MKEYLSQKGIRFAFVSITDSMFGLKQFLKYRDQREEFAKIREAGAVGIPCIVVNNEKIYFAEDVENVFGK